MPAGCNRTNVWKQSHTCPEKWRTRSQCRIHRWSHVLSNGLVGSPAVNEFIVRPLCLHIREVYMCVPTIVSVTRTLRKSHDMRLLISLFIHQVAENNLKPSEKHEVWISRHNHTVADCHWCEMTNYDMLWNHFDRIERKLSRPISHISPYIYLDS